MSELRDPATAGIDRELLDQVDLFALAPPAIRDIVAASFEARTYAFGDVIVREGEDADAFYVLASGRARVVKRGAGDHEVTLATLGPGDAFGEVGLLERATRMATVRASGDSEVLRLDRSLFTGLLRTHPEIRESVELHRRRIQLTELFRMYTVFAELPPEGLERLLRDVEELEVAAGEVLIAQGAPAGPAFVVEEGKLRTHHHGRDLAFHRRGDVVGERSLFTGTSRAATVEAVTDARLLRLPVGTYRQLLDAHPDFAERMAQRIAQYDYETTARVPLDFGEELLPADVRDAPAGEGAEEALDRPPATAPDPDADTFVPQGRPASRVRRRRVPQIWQIDEMDCGAACLAMVSAAHGHPISLTQARDAVGTDLSGSSLAGIVRGAEALGFRARPVKVSKRNLEDLPLPAIVHWDDYHWVVVEDAGQRRVRIVDPAIGRRRLDRDEFERRWNGYTAVLEPTPAVAEAGAARSGSLRWMRELVSRHRGRITVAVVLALVASALQMAMPVFLQVVVDRVLPGGDVALLRGLLLAMVAVLAAMVVANVVHRYLLSWIALRIDGAAMGVLTERLLALPMSYFHTRRTGDIQRRLGGAQQIRAFAVQDGVFALTAITQLVAAVAIMLSYSALLAGVYLAAVPVYAGLMRFGSIRLRPLFDQLEEAFGRYYSRQVDAVKGIEAVKAMGAEPELRRELVEEFDGLSRKLFRADFGAMLYHSGVQLVAFASLILFLWVGSVLVLRGTITVGALVSFSALVVFANSAVLILLSLWDQSQRTSVLVGRLRDVFEVEPEQGEDRDHLAPVPTLSGQVALQGVGFRYGPHGTPVLSDVDLEVAPGTTVAIVGRSGSGKTTLAKCLVGLLEPTDGTITFDGVDMTTLDFRQLRRHVGVVLQDSYVFADTIARNIAFGEAEPDLERVEWAARAANAHDFVARLPLGYDTRVGETGLALSGGQQQRVAIARAVYHQPPLLILDEATSALDAESEQAVQDSLDRLLAQRTSFVIAHRLSTIREADVIVVLDRGRIVEQGPRRAPRPPRPVLLPGQPPAGPVSSAGAAPAQDGRSSPVDPTRPAAPAFRVDDATYRWEHVHAHAGRTGDRAILEARVRQALAAERLASSEGGGVDRRALRAAEAAFRRARRLHAAEDLERWLEERGLTVGDWRRHVRAELLRTGHAGQLEAATARHPPEPEEAERALSLWGRCTDAKATWARTLATHVAGAHAVCDRQHQPYPEPGDDIALDALAGRFAVGAASRERIDALIVSRTMAWLRLECEVAVFRTSDAAREALACLRDDGWTLVQAASAGGTRVRRRRLWVDDVDEQLRHTLIRAREGELIGPLALASGPALVHVHRKREPSAEDDEIRARAVRELVATASEREVADRVRWMTPIR